MERSRRRHDRVAGAGHDGNTHRSQRHGHLRRIGVRLGDDADVRGPKPSLTLVIGQTADLEESQHLGGEVIEDHGLGFRHRAARHRSELDRSEATVVEDGAIGAVGGLDRFEEDIGGTELLSGEDRLDRGEHRGVGTPVGGQGPDDTAGAGGVGPGLEVRGELSPPESVDRLLGIADDHHRDRTALEERGPEDVPLDTVGVLELVDHDETEPVAQFGDERWSTLGRQEQVSGVGDHRVEGAPSPAASGRLDRLDAAVDEIGDLRGVGVVPQTRVRHREPAGDRVTQPLDGSRRDTPEGQQSVVDHLVDVGQ